MAGQLLRDLQTTLVVVASGVLGLVAGIVGGVTIERGTSPELSRLLSYLAANPSALSAVGTIGLVFLTAVYAYQTRKLVVTEYRAREQERVESWYGETLTTVRRMNRNWRFLLRHRASGGVVRLADNESTYQELQELAEQLETQVAGRPYGVDEELVEVADAFFEEWKQLTASNDPTVAYDHDGLGYLDTLQAEIRTQSEWYGPRTERARY